MTLQPTSLGSDPVPQPTKLLLVAQFYGADQDQMLELLRLIYDLQQEPSNADILIFPRKDTKTRDIHCFDFLKGKFDVYRGRSRRIVAGWPFGPNAVAMDVFRLMYETWMVGSFIYKAVLLMESDCVPLRPSWIAELGEEWDKQSKLVLGHWDGSGTVIKPPTSHVNGNLLFHPSIVDNVRELAYDDLPRWGWDMAYWTKIAPFATPSRLIYNDYRLNTTNNPLVTPERLFRPRFHTHPENPLFGQELNPCWVHGSKGTKAIEYVRQRFLC
jgi:hypothetical protein